MTIKTVCMDCGVLIVDGPLSKDGLVSDGLCPKDAERRKREMRLSGAPIRIRLGDTIQYQVSYGDEHPVPVGTIVYGKIVGRSAGTVNIHWDKLGITEYGVPEEIVEKVERS